MGWPPVLANLDFGWATASDILTLLLVCLICLAVAVWLAGVGILLWRGWQRVSGRALRCMAWWTRATAPG